MKASLKSSRSRKPLIVLAFALLLAGGSGCGGSGSGGGTGGGGGGGGSAPVAPTGLTATPGDTQVSLAWSASSGATSYHVKRSTASGGPYTQVANPTAASYTDTGLTDATKYYYVVSAVNSAGESANSSEVTATPLLAVPAVPTGLAAIASNAQVSLTWTATAGATTYNVKRSTTSGSGYAKIAAPTAPNFTDTGLTNGTSYYYVVSAVNAAGESANSPPVSAAPSVPTADVTVTVNPTQTKAISPYIYGLNFYSGNTNPPALLTFDRAGGNRWTAYNWENNYSNAGSDYGPYSNDTYLSSSTIPAEAIQSFVAGDQGNKMASLVTFQLQGYVSADANGNVDVTVPLATRLAARFKQVVDKKSTQSSVPFTTTPPTADAYVYMDELAWALDQKLPGIFGASPTYPTFIQLDNEPELWNSTHLEVQGPTAVKSDTYITNTITLTKALKDLFPNVLIFGPVHYGFEGIYSWQGELSATPTGANWFPDKYLTAIKTASSAYGKPLVDVYDFHWYVEVYDSSGTRILDLNGTTLTDAQVQLIVQSPRELWDTTFNDDNNSNPWIYNTLGETPINILGRLQAKIAAENPGMKLSITEYNNGGSQHIAGTIAQADNLGIFGAQGLFAANLWPLSNNEPYILAGFRAFRAFDGSNACFGDTSLNATSSDVSKVAVYASQDTTTPGRYVFVAINRSTAAQVTAITGITLSGTAYLYQMTASSAATQSTIQPVPAGQQPVNGSTLTLTLPALSVTTIDVH
jgi:fibronectin type 3 domain-containing protein